MCAARGITLMESKSYIGRAECGCIRAAVINDAKDANYVAKFVAGLVLEGLRVDLVNSQWVRDNFKRCPHRESR